jgi:hypothetical protein
MSIDVVLLLKRSIINTTTECCCCCNRWGKNCYRRRCGCLPIILVFGFFRRVDLDIVVVFAFSLVCAFVIMR